MEHDDTIINEVNCEKALSNQMLIIFVPSDEDEVSEDPRPVPRKSKKKYGKVIQHFLILHFDL